MKIYIVFGQTGEFSDFREWPVKAFKTKIKARKLHRKLNTIAKNGKGARHAFAWTDRLRTKLGEAGDLDAQVDYTGTEYKVCELEFEA